MNAVGKTFGRLLVLKEIKNNAGISLLKCICNKGTCGNVVLINKTNVLNGNTKSCGCYKSDVSRDRLLKHGKLKTRVYRIWKAMKQRCYNEKHDSYKYYGGKGIKVCDEWCNSFEAFLNDMGEPPSDNHTLDRIDSFRDYCKENCRWATWAEQQINKRNIVFYFHEGRAMNLTAWCRELNLDYEKCYKRIRSGWTFTEAVINNKRN